MRRFAPLIMLLAFSMACHQGRPVRPTPGSTDQYLILAAELETSQHQNLFDAVRQLRPFWFGRSVGGRTGENTIAVYADNQLVGTLSALKRFSVFGAERVRYLSSTEAQTRFGQINGGRAAIVVETVRH